MSIVAQTLSMESSGWRTVLTDLKSVILFGQEGVAINKGYLLLQRDGWNCGEGLIHHRMLNESLCQDLREGRVSQGREADG